VSEASILALIPGSKETKSIQSLEWIEFENSVENSGQSYLLVLYRNNNNLILYDTELGEIVWNKHFDRNIKSISIDPYCKNNMLFGISSNECCFGIVDDLRANKSPNRDPKEYKINIKGSTATPNSPKTSGPLLKYSLFVKSVNNESQDSNDLSVLNEYIQVCYHRSVRNQIFIVFSREILLIDLSIEAIICSIPLERSCSNIMTVYSCNNRNAFYVCHEFGTVSLRLFQKQMITDSSEGTSSLNIGYINLCQSDGLRLTKQNKIFGYSVSKLDETKVALLLNNGRLIIKTVCKRDENLCEEELRVPYICDLIPLKHYQMSETKTKTKIYRILMTHLLPALSYNPNVIRMCPAVTLRNWPIHKPLLAVGDSSGTIQIWNLSLTTLEREFSIHSFPVRGIEWTGLSTFISFAYPTVSPNSGKTNNELNITDVTSGRTVPLRAERNLDSSPIELLRISHLKQYLIILLKDDPFEIWDLKTLSLLRVMPKQFATITAIEWSPLYNKRIDYINTNTNDSVGHQLPSKENFVVTNKNGELYHFSIEGNIVKEITCIPPDTEMNVNITCIAWKSDQVLLGDGIGNVNVWDLKKKISRAEPTHRGSIKKLRFGPGRGNMKFLILYNDGVDIWDIKELKLNAQLKYPRDINFKIIDIDWAGSDRPILVTSEGTILITDIKLKQYTSTISDLVFNDIDNQNIDLFSFNFHLLPQMSQFIFKSKFILNQSEDGPKLPECDIERNILVAKLFHDFDGYNFWNIVSYVIADNKERLDLNNDLYLDNNYFKDIETEKVTLLESIRNTYNQSRICYELLLLLNQPHRAVQLLLETDPHSMSDYYVDALKACLIASLQSRREDSTAYPVVKLVATNLIANGMIDEGSQLLCLIGKAQDACRYLQSANKWLDAVWLAKVS
jgi:WD40 repeat protein